MATPNLSTELLRTFVAVVEADGFLRAAERLHKTQSTVSQQIQRLEEEVGTKLFKPNGRKRALTTAGETFHGYARRIIDLQENALAAIASPQPAGQLRLGVSNSLSDGPLPALLTRFARTYPNVQVNVRTGFSAGLVAGFERGEFDAVLVLDEPGNTRNGVVLESSQMVWIGPEAFEWDRRQPLPIASFDNPCGFHKAATTALDRARIPWRLVYTTSSVTGLIAAVRAGMAVTVRTPHSLQQGTALVQTELVLPELPSLDVLLLRAKAMPLGGALEDMLEAGPLLGA
ncbi:MAG: LysR family transcriptional regulator [Gammaproteobacteria bacterium]|nr:LysR family transcriptional regulator [Gammaproteobacteria bacterium]